MKKLNLLNHNIITVQIELPDKDIFLELLKDKHNNIKVQSIKQKLTLKKTSEDGSGRVFYIDYVLSQEDIPFIVATLESAWSGDLDPESAHWHYGFEKIGGDVPDFEQVCMEYWHQNAAIGEQYRRGSRSDNNYNDWKEATIRTKGFM